MEEILLEIPNQKENHGDTNHVAAHARNITRNVEPKGDSWRISYATS
jgi:hypothetical protein